MHQTGGSVTPHDGFVRCMYYQETDRPVLWEWRPWPSTLRCWQREALGEGGRPRQFEECENKVLRGVDMWMVPRYRRMTSMARKRGVDLAFVDSDGDVRQLIPLWQEAGTGGVYPMEVAADMDVGSLFSERVATSPTSTTRSRMTCLMKTSPTTGGAKRKCWVLDSPRKPATAHAFTIGAPPILRNKSRPAGGWKYLHSCRSGNCNGWGNEKRRRRIPPCGGALFFRPCGQCGFRP